LPAATRWSGHETTAASPPHLIDLSHIEGLDGIEMKGRSLVIGAPPSTPRWATSAVGRRSHPGAGRTRRHDRRPRGAPQRHHRGSLANNDPTADYPAAVLALGATIVTKPSAVSSRRVLPGHVHHRARERRDHHQGDVPAAKKAAYIKFRNQASRYALVGVFVAKRPSDVRVAVPAPVRRRVPREPFEEA